jgi:hypothetical protein
MEFLRPYPRLLPAVLILVLAACASWREERTATAPAVQPPAVAAPAAPAEPPSAPPPAAEPAESVDHEDHGAHADMPATPPAQPPAAAAAPQPARPAPREAAPASPYVFEVTAAPKDPSHPFYGVGHRLGFVVNGVQGKTLVVVRGKTYSFKVDTNIQHDFYLSTSPVGWGAAAYTDGVSGQFIYQGVVTFTPGAQTPNLLYYACRNHKNMGGPIFVVNEGEEGKPIEELRASRAGAGAAAPAAPAQGGAQPSAPGGAVSEAQVTQKVQFADMFIHQSGAAKRIKDSGQPMALELYRSALAKFDASKQSLSGRKFGDALAQVDEAMRLMSEASLQVPEQVSDETLRARFDELYKGVQAFEASYVRNYEQMAKKKDKQALPKVDLKQIHAVMDSAQGLARDGKYDEAVSMLSSAQDTITSALTQLLASESLSYELKFDTPKEEYEYELSRYLSYEELVPLAIEQRQPSGQTLETMNQLVARAQEIKRLSEPEAKKGNYAEAIQMLQGATSHVERALQAVGVR